MTEGLETRRQMLSYGKERRYVTNLRKNNQIGVGGQVKEKGVRNDWKNYLKYFWKLGGKALACGR